MKWKKTTQELWGYELWPTHGWWLHISFWLYRVHFSKLTLKTFYSLYTWLEECSPLHNSIIIKCETYAHIHGESAVMHSRIHNFTHFLLLHNQSSCKAFTSPQPLPAAPILLSWLISQFRIFHLCVLNYVVMGTISFRHYLFFFLITPFIYCSPAVDAYSGSAREFSIKKRMTFRASNNWSLR